MAALAGLLKPQAVPSGVEGMLQRLMEQQQQQQQQIAALMLQQQQMSYRLMGSGFAPQPVAPQPGGMGVAYSGSMLSAYGGPVSSASLLSGGLHPGTSPLGDAAAWPLGGSLAPPSHQGLLAPLLSDQVTSGWPFGSSLAPASQQGPLGGPFAPPPQQVSPFVGGNSVPEGSVSHLIKYTSYPALPSLLSCRGSLLFWPPFCLEAQRFRFFIFCLIHIDVSIRNQLGHNTIALASRESSTKNDDTN